MLRPIDRRSAPVSLQVSRLVLALMLVGALPGCEGQAGRMVVHPVRGKVMMDGRPATGADIVFYPAQPLSDKDADYPRGAVSDDGSFAIGTYGVGDGAPAGRYRVSIFRGGGSESEGLRAVKVMATDAFKKYKDPEGSGLTVTVKEGSNDLPPFLLTSGAAK